MKITSKYTTYRVTGYTHQVGTDPRAIGAIHKHQVRKAGKSILYRIVESNGKFQSATTGIPATAEQIAAAESSKY